MRYEQSTDTKLYTTSQQAQTTNANSVLFDNQGTVTAFINAHRLPPGASVSFSSPVANSKDTTQYRIQFAPGDRGSTGSIQELYVAVIQLNPVEDAIRTAKNCDKL